MSKKHEEPAHLIASLYDTCAELMALARLLENERPEHQDLTDDEIEEKRGLGIIVRRIAKQVREYGRILDEWTVRKGDRK
jgi:hypothetical protein